MAGFSYTDAMGENGAHIRVKLATDEPVALSDFVGSFVGLGNQFEKFIALEHPELKAESEIFVKEVRSGSIEADLVPWLVAGGATLLGAASRAAEIIETGKTLAGFVRSLAKRLSPYFNPGGRSPDASASDLADFLKATAAIAQDPKSSATIEAAVFEDGERKVRAAFTFTSADARRAEQELSAHRRELEAKTDENQGRVLLQFVRPSVEAGKPGKRGGERGVIASIAKRPLPVLYASTLAEERMRHEKIQLQGNIFRALFDVSVNVEHSANGRPRAYRITEVHAVIEDSGDGDLVEGSGDE